MSKEPSNLEFALIAILAPTIMGVGIGLFLGVGYLIFSLITKLL